MYYFIYKTTNIENGKTYIGCHKTNVIDDGYLGSGTVLRRAISKYGRDKFVRVILEFVESEDLMYEVEKKYVDEVYVDSDMSYNVRCGGLGGRLNQEIRSLISEKLRKPKAEETKEKMRLYHTGRTRSEQTKANMREAHKNRLPPTEEARKKMSERAKSRANNACGTKWINNGVICKRVPKEFVLTSDWKEGRIKQIMPS